MRNYILDDQKTVVPCDHILKWGAWMETAERQVADETIGEAQISTVFLGIDHNWRGGPPILWETMVFGGALDGEQDRCSGTWDDAKAMHGRMAERVKGNA